MLGVHDAMSNVNRVLMCIHVLCACGVDGVYMLLGLLVYSAIVGIQRYEIDDVAYVQPCRDSCADAVLTTHLIMSLVTKS